MERQRISWIILTVVWLALAAGAKAVLVEMELIYWWRIVATIPVLFLFYLSAKYILTWGGAWRMGLLELLQNGLSSTSQSEESCDT
jgi:hypothetical protein